MSIVKITKPGVYEDLPAIDYHAQHDWLSWSNAKKLVPPSTPAHLKAAMAAGQERKRHFDVGKVVHARILGEGDEYVVVQAQRRDKTLYDARDYVTVSAQAHRDEIYEAGKVPILATEIAAADQMAASVAAHPVANALLTNGTPEVSLFWVDEATGVKCRARLDWLPDKVKGQMIVPDLKTAVTAAPSEFAKAAAKYGYYGQQAHYLDGIRACDIDPDPAFMFVVVEKTDPWPVIVGRFANQLDLQLANATVDRARRIWRECIETDTWPAYPGGVIDLNLPVWLHYELEGFTETEMVI